MGVVGCDTGTWTPFCPDAEEERKTRHCESLGRDRDTKETWDKGENIKRKVGLRLETAGKQARTGVRDLIKGLWVWAGGCTSLVWQRPWVPLSAPEKKGKDCDLAAMKGKGRNRYLADTCLWLLPAPWHQNTRQ